MMSYQYIETDMSNMLQHTSVSGNLFALELIMLIMTTCFNINNDKQGKD